MPQHIDHGFAPVYDSSTRVLLLGTMPSPKSREMGFYYGHPRNRFWPTMARVFGESPGETPAQRTAFLLRHGIGLWDVLASCEIEGAADSTIRNPVVNDFVPIFQLAQVEQVYTTGSTAWRLYQRYSPSAAAHPALCLPSTSPANARCSLERLVDVYGVLLSHCT